MGKIVINHVNAERVAHEAREDGLIRAAARVVVLIQSVTPVGLTGHLRRSIERGELDEGARFIWVVAMAAYSIYVERGTGIYAAEGRGRRTPWVYRDFRGNFYTTEGMRPQPFMTRGLDLAARAP
jgi:hypothetical protein